MHVFETEQSIEEKSYDVRFAQVLRQSEEFLKVAVAELEHEVKLGEIQQIFRYAHIVQFHNSGLIGS